MRLRSRQSGARPRRNRRQRVRRTCALRLGAALRPRAAVSRAGVPSRGSGTYDRHPPVLWEAETARLEPGQREPWPHARLRSGGTVDLTEVPGPEAESHDDLFVTELEAGWLSVRKPHPALTFRLEWDPAVFAWVVLWQPYGGARANPLPAPTRWASSRGRVGSRSKRRWRWERRPSSRAGDGLKRRCALVSNAKYPVGRGQERVGEELERRGDIRERAPRAAELVIRR